MNYAVYDSSPIELSNAFVSCKTLVEVIEVVNDNLSQVSRRLGNASLELYDIIDFRMLSGLIGEMFINELSTQTGFLRKNPNIDGYPDLLDVSGGGVSEAIKKFPPNKFLKFKYGGLEVKNTFGVKKSKANISYRESRLSMINSQLVWKAHHRETNNLIALQSDYVNRIPQLISIFYSAELTENDWTIKQQPAAGSTMTSFCQTKPTAYNKLKQGLKVYRKNIGLERFLEIAE